MSSIDVYALDSGYGPVTVLRGVSLSLSEGSFGVVIGPNGAGKSTLLLTIAGLLSARHGSVRFDGRDVTREPAYRRTRCGLSLVSEQLNLFPSMTVLENLLVGGRSCKRREQLDRRLREIFDLFPRLAERSGQLAGTLSGGERKMLAFGRALMSAPTVLLIDEPSNGLAPNVVENLFQVIRNFKLRGMTVLLVEQHVHRALALADQAWLLERGQIRLSGDAKALAQNPYVREVYLGQH